MITIRTIETESGIWICTAVIEGIEHYLTGDSMDDVKKQMKATLRHNQIPGYEQRWEDEWLP